MKRLIALIVTISLISPIWSDLWAAFSLKSHGVYQGGFDGGTSGNFDTSVGSPDLLLLVVSYQNAQSFTLSDNQSNSFANRIDPSGESDGGGKVAVFYVVNPTTSGTHTFTLSGTGIGAALAWETFTGVNTGDPYDTSVGANIPGAGSGTSLAVGPITTTSGELIMTGLSNFIDTSNTDRVIDSGFTITDQAGFVGATSYPIAMAYKFQTGASETPTWSWDNTSAYVSATISTFKGTGGGGATPTGDTMPLLGI